jgi:DNA repair protein SbcC/Rad50
MRLNRLRLTNFRQHVDTRIDFEAGITGIIGPNGAGKSTLLEAIAWALYGMPAARGTRESIRSTRAPARAPVKVELEFELSGHRYLVSRGLNNAEVYLDGSSTPVANSISEVANFLRRRLGMSHDEFFNTYFTGQKELGVMAAMGPTDRAQFLSRVLGYERLRTAQELVRKRRSGIDAELRGLRAGMPEPETVRRAATEANERVASAESRVVSTTTQRERSRAVLDELAPRWEALQRERDVLQAIVAELRVADSERIARERERDRIQGDLDEIAVAREELARLAVDLEPLPALESELRGAERASNEVARRQTLTQQMNAVTEELNVLIARRAKLESVPTLEADALQALAIARPDLEQAQKDFEGGQTDWVRDKQEAETKRQALREQLMDVQRQRDQILELGENGTCPICARPLETHFRTVLDVLDGQIETITIDGKYFRARIEQLAAMPAAVAAFDEKRRALAEQVRQLERGLATLAAQVQELRIVSRDVESKEKRRDALIAELGEIAVDYDAARHTELKTRVERLVPLSARATRLSAQIEREATLTPERDRVRESLGHIATRIAELSVKRDALAFSEQSFAAVRDAFEQAAAALRTAELASVAADAELAAARVALAAAAQSVADLARAEARLAELSADRRVHDELDRAFGDIRTDLNQELRPELSDRASGYLRELTDGRYSELELDDQYNVIVLEDAIPKPVISGGEEDLANLVLRLAISEMIAERAGQAFSLLVLDEVFGSLDESRRHNVVDLLRRLQDRFEQVILITHIESVREGLDRVVTIRYDDESGTSAVETELPSGAVAFDPLPAGAAD